VSNFDVNVADLELQEDFEAPISSEGYADQAPPAPPRAANYRFGNFEIAQDKDAAGTPRVDTVNGKSYPVFQIRTAEIVEGLENPRKVFLFQRLRTRPFRRQTVDGVKFASELGDFVRGLDSEASFAGTEQLIAKAKELVDQGTTAVGFYNWTAYDKDFVETEKARLSSEGLSDEAFKKALNEVYRKARVKGMNKFPKTASGAHLGQMKSPNGSGAVLEARGEIQSFVPSSEAGGIKLG
jgi:hypothetical protein